MCWACKEPAEAHDLGGTLTHNKEKRKTKEREDVTEDMVKLRRSIMARIDAVEMETKTLHRKEKQLLEETYNSERKRATREREEERAMIRKYPTTTQLFFTSEEESYKRSPRSQGRVGLPEAARKWTQMAETEAPGRAPSPTRTHAEVAEIPSGIQQGGDPCKPTGGGREEEREQRRTDHLRGNRTPGGGRNQGHEGGTGTRQSYARQG